MIIGPLADAINVIAQVQNEIEADNTIIVVYRKIYLNNLILKY